MLRGCGYTAAPEHVYLVNYGTSPRPGAASRRYVDGPALCFKQPQAGPRGRKIILPRVPRLPRKAGYAAVAATTVDGDEVGLTSDGGGP